jgi:hypothetical protein
MPVCPFVLARSQISWPIVAAGAVIVCEEPQPQWCQREMRLGFGPNVRIRPPPGLPVHPPCRSTSGSFALGLCRKRTLAWRTVSDSASGRRAQNDSQTERTCAGIAAARVLR